MKKALIVATLTLTAGLAAYSSHGHKVPGWGSSAYTADPARPRKTMRPFSSEAELKEHFKKFQARSERQRAAQFGSADSTANAASPAAPSMSAKSDDSKAGASKDQESITNTQHAGVDEGGIVKVHGDHLVILRRGRLFTVRVGGNALDPAFSVNAYPPNVDPSQDWYDEMLVSNDTVVVIGYSYGRGGTEINLFDINSSGELKYRSTYHLRSNDYYSSRNYASRLIGDKLIFYTPEYMGYYSDAQQQFPAIRKWHRGAKDSEFKPVVGAVDIYRAERPVDETSVSALHTVTICDLASRDMSCHGTAVLGAPAREFYVSPKSVYVWTSDFQYGGRGEKQPSMLYKLPLDGSAPSAIGVEGGPVDQFSFLESADERLNVLIRSEPSGGQMWGSERSSGDTALLRISPDKFGDGSTDAEHDAYLDVPNVEGYTMQNRFVGDHVLYGSGNGWGGQKQTDAGQLFAVNWRTGKQSRLTLTHSVDRIEPLGNAAVVVGTNGSDLFFTPVRLDGSPNVEPSYIRRGASQGELRSHGFFYKPDGDESGVLGLPIAREGRQGWRHLQEDSAAIIFLRNDSLQFSQLGELEAHNASSADGCRASCVDWYGNARPIFLKGRIFALLGYELVEGKVSRDRLREVRRVNYTPRGWWPIDERNSEEE